MGNWGSKEVEELQIFYKENDIPSDQLVKDRAALDKFVETLNNKLGIDNCFSVKEVADKLFKLRKSCKLPLIRD
jgi:hypothetical protein